MSKIILADVLRSWAAGDPPAEAGIEVIIRGHLLRRLGMAWAGGSLDADALRGALTQPLSGGERRLGHLASALLGVDPLLDVTGVVAGLDDHGLAVALAALAHASCRPGMAEWPTSMAARSDAGA